MQQAGSVDHLYDRGCFDRAQSVSGNPKYQLRPKPLSMGKLSIEILYHRIIKIPDILFDFSLYGTYQVFFLFSLFFLSTILRLFENPIRFMWHHPKINSSF
jgi:hypothetical protein